MSKGESPIAYVTEPSSYVKRNKIYEKKMDNLKLNLQLSDYPLHFINSPLNPAMEIICPKNQRDVTCISITFCK